MSVYSYDSFDKFLVGKEVEFYRNHDIKPFTTMGIGGIAKRVVLVNSRAQLTDVLVFCSGSFPFVLLGRGSNVIFSGESSAIPVIVNRSSEMKRVEGNLVKLDSGVLNTDFLTWAAANRVGGLDFMAGIPGTVGGAAAVNAGAFGKSISMVLEKADIFSPDSKVVKTVSADYFRFQYRNSVFKTGSDVILSLYLSFIDECSDSIREKVKGNIKYRSDNHPPFNFFTAGCFFKNPVIEGKKLSAGKLIENCGFKGQKRNRLEISPAHANFVINSGSASFADIAALEKEIIRTVKEEKGIPLEREVIYISPDGEKY
ncbi:MAG: UDP-N-acetylmuramate dehydrogenase [bacterium]|nr:UDP-N-acetylmuramate dehydrogenase [bacterium]